jgi:quercetin dioxygenase-like cupin family protein
MVGGPDPFDVKGAGTVALATVVHSPCSVRARPVGPTKRVIRAAVAPELVWAGGTMRAHLDVEKEVSPEAYLGRLEGTAPVAEHLHATSWEIIMAVDATGTFTLDGKPARLGPRSVVAVPPNVKHAWQPDEGSKLVAVQMYAPPGPEQRFRTLAAAAVDAGPPDGGHP